MSDISNNSLLNQYMDQQEEIQNRPPINPLLNDYIRSQEPDVSTRLEYENEDLTGFMNSPLILNRLKISASPEKDASQYATTFLMSKELNIPIDKVMANYDQYARAFYGDEDPISNRQKYVDTFNRTWTNLKVSSLGEKLRIGDYTPEERADLEEKQRLLNYGLPPELIKPTTIEKMLTGAFGQTANWAYALLGVTPYEDIKKGIEDSKSEKGRKVGVFGTTHNTFLGGLSGFGDYTNGLLGPTGATITNKPEDMTWEEFQETPSFARALSRSGHVDPQAFLMMPSKMSGAPVEWLSNKASKFLTAGFLSRWQEYSETETGSIYNELSSIEGPNGEKLDESYKIVYSDLAGQLSSFTEAIGDTILLKGGKTMKAFAGIAFSNQTKMIASGALDTAMGKAVTELMARAVIPLAGEVFTEEVQAAISMINQNFIISMEENSDLFDDSLLSMDDALGEFKDVGIQSLLVSTPLVLLGGAFSSSIDQMRSNNVLKKEISVAVSNIVKANPKLEIKEMFETIRTHPSMEKFSDKGIERELSRVNIQEETGKIIDTKIKFTKEDYTKQKHADMLADFKKENKGLIEGSPEFNQLFEQFKIDNHAEYFTTERALDEVALKELYEKEHLITPEPTIETVMVEDFDVNGDSFMTESKQIVQGDPYYDMPYSSFVRQRREIHAYSQSWVKTPEGQKYLATMSPAVEVINRVLQEDLTPGTRNLLQKQQDRIVKIVNGAKSGSTVVTMADLRTQTNLEVNAINDKISQLEALSRENRDNNDIRKDISTQKRELIRTKREIESSYTQVNHVLESVTREIFNMNRIKSSLENTHSRLSTYLKEYNSEEWQAFYKNLDTNTKAEDLIKTLFRDEYNLGIDENNDLVKDPELENVLDDIFGKTHEGYKNLNKALQKIVRETSDTAQVRKDLENFQKMLINKMQRALSNYLKLNGDKYMESIMGDIGKNVSQPAVDKITAIQDSIKKVDSAVSHQDILNAEEYVNEKLFPKDKEGQTTPYGRSAYDIASSRVSDILMRELKITYDANATAIRPKMSLEQLIQLKTEIDLMKYLGKLELAALQEDNFITTEILKSEFLSYQKSITDRSDKKSNPFKTAKFQVMMAAHWSQKLFGEKGYKFFWGDKLQADSDAKSQMNRRADEITNKTGLDKKEIAHAMFQKKEFNGKEYTVQQLMFYYLAKDFKDQDVWTALTSNNGNRVDKELIGDYGAETAAVDDLLDETEKKIALAMQDDLESAWNRVAATYEGATGSRLGKIMGYLPMQVLGGDHTNLEEDIYTSMFRGSDYDEKGVAKGMVFERTPTTEQSAKEINDGLWDVWQNYIHKQEHYIAHDEWVRRAKQFMDDPDIKGTIKENFDPSWEKGINKYINDIADPTALHGSSAIDSFSRILRHNIAVSALAARPAIILRQIPSVIMYLSEAGISEFSQSVWEYNTSWYVKDGKLRNSVKDFITEKDPTTIESDIGVEDMLSYRNPTSKAAEIKNKVDNIGMAGIKWTDLNMKATGWKAIYNKYESSLGEKGAIRKAREFTALTQPSSDKTTLPGLYRHSELMNIFMMFTQQPTKIYNYFAYDVVPNLNPLNKDANRMAGVYGLTAIMGMNAAIWALTQKRMPEDPEDWVSALTIGSVSTIPVAGKGIAAGIRGEEIYGGGDIVTDTISGIFDIFDLESWQDASGDSNKTLKKINSVQNSMSAFGWPSAVVDDWIDAIVTEDKTNVILGGNKGVKDAK